MGNIISSRGKLYQISSEDDIEDLFNRGDIIDKIEMDLWRDILREGTDF